MPLRRVDVLESSFDLALLGLVIGMRFLYWDSLVLIDRPRPMPFCFGSRERYESRDNEHPVQERNSVCSVPRF